MRLILPEQMWQALRELIESSWLPRSPHNSITPKSPKDIAILLMHVQNSSLVFPLDNFISIRLTQLLTAAMQLAGVEATTNKNWWNQRIIKISTEVLPDINLLHGSLAAPTDEQAVSVWTRPIACIVKRVHTSVALSDAAYTGMGG